MSKSATITGKFLHDK